MEDVVKDHLKYIIDNEGHCGKDVDEHCGKCPFNGRCQAFVMESRAMSVNAWKRIRHWKWIKSKRALELVKRLETWTHL